MNCPNCNRQMDEREIDWENDVCRICEHEERKETDLKELIQKEILSILDEKIDNELNLMKNNFTVVEIAREVLKC